jgi:predicted phage terminase large subunit-like protein
VNTRAVREKDNHPETKEFGGTPAWPERFNEEVLEEIETALGPYMFSTLMMNMPTSAANMVFRRQWIRYFDAIDITKLVTCTTVDPAAVEKETTGDPDYTVVLTTGVDTERGLLYILGYDRERMNPGETIDRVFSHNSLYKPVITKIESNAYQRTLKYWIEQRQRQLREYFYIEAVPSLKCSKEDRIRALQPFFSNLLVHMRTHMAELERELLAFPSARGHDDCADALSMQVPFWNETLGTMKKRHEEKLSSNPFSGKSIIESILGRANQQEHYPYDMGHMAHRLRSPYPTRRIAV